MRLLFVGTSAGNLFMTELLEALSFEARRLGVRSDVVFDHFPADDDAVYATIGHEFYGTIDRAAHPTYGQLRRTIGLGVEMPGTEWFTRNLHAANLFAANVAITRSAMAAMRMAGVETTHLQLGYHEPWDQWHGASSPRPIDATYLGSVDDRRGALLGGIGIELSEWNTKFLVPPLDPKTAAAENYLVRGDKHRHLAASRVLINLHRGDARSLEWVRVVEAMCNGCLVASEYSYDIEPLSPGDHFIVTAPEGMGAVVDALLRDEPRRERLARDAYDHLRNNVTLASGTAHLLERAEALLAATRRTAPARHDADDADDDSNDPRDTPGHGGSQHTNDDDDQPPAPMHLHDVRASNEARRRTVVDQTAPTTPTDTMLAALRDLEIGQRQLQRSIQALAPADSDADWHPDGWRIEYSNRTAESAPSVSVLLSVHNYENEVRDALASINAQTIDDLEIVVIDDASTDRSLAVVIAYAEDHPHLTITVVRHRINAGPGPARNTALANAVGEFVMILDADNTAAPTAAERLRSELRRHPDAAFAYPMLVRVRDGRSIGLMSALPWDPAALRRGNYIDAFALIRRAAVQRLGGYIADPRAQGLEDFDLWCRFAEAGDVGRLVPQVLGTYRVHGNSFTATFTVHQHRALSIIASRSPRLFAAAEPDVGEQLGPVD